MASNDQVFDDFALNLAALAGEQVGVASDGVTRAGTSVNWADLSQGQQARVEAIRENPSLALAVWASELLGEKSGIMFANALVLATRGGLATLGRLLVGMREFADVPRRAVSAIPDGCTSIDVGIAMSSAAKAKNLVATHALSLQDLAWDGPASAVKVEYTTFQPTMVIEVDEKPLLMLHGRPIRGDKDPQHTKVKTLTKAQAQFLPHVSIWAKLTPANWNGGFTPSALPPVRKHTSLGALGDPRGGPNSEVAAQVMRIITAALRDFPAGKPNGGMEAIADIMAERIDPRAYGAIETLINAVRRALPARPAIEKHNIAALSARFVECVKTERSRGAVFDPLKRFAAVLNEARDSRSSVDEAGKGQCGWTGASEIHNGLSITEKQHRALAVATQLLDTKETHLWVVGAGKRAHVMAAVDLYKWADVTVLDIEPSSAASRKHRALNQDFLALDSLPSTAYVFSDAFAPMIQATKKGTGVDNSYFTRSWQFAVKCAQLKVGVFTCKLFLPETTDYYVHTEVYECIFSDYDLIGVTHGARVHSGEFYGTFRRRDSKNEKPQAAFAKFVVDRLPQAEWGVYANVVRNTFASIGLAPPSDLFIGALNACFEGACNVILPSYSVDGRQPGDYANPEEPSYDPAKFIMEIEEGMSLAKLAAMKLTKAEPILVEGNELVARLTGEPSGSGSGEPHNF